LIYTTGMTLLENGIPGSVHSCAACKWILYRSALSSFSFYLYRNLSSFLCEISVYYWGETLEAGGCMWEFYIDIIGNQFFINTGWGISRLTPLYPTNSLLAAFKMAAVAPMSRISYSFTPTTIYCEPNACLIRTFDRGTWCEYSHKFLSALCIIHAACQFFPKRFAPKLQ